MANFVLQYIDDGIWQGPPNAKVTLGVESEDDNDSTLLGAAYPHGTQLKPSDAGTVSFNIASDAAHSLAVSITPAVPPDDWSIVEVAPDGSTQSLLDMAAGAQVGGIVIRPAAVAPTAVTKDA